MIIAEDGRVIEWQRLAEELFGWSAEEAVGQSVLALMREINAGDGGRRGSSLTEPRYWSRRSCAALPLFGGYARQRTPFHGRTWRY
ncbi:PAS domain-containing protein [Streptomyces sp. NPDC088253]|uniref:PAS domain-containing protein n=1 Tax=Streptomyces sp. NPDC088253 TaxID=3365846 RepID=UPI003826D566